jgi:hypothetical protein
MEHYKTKVAALEKLFHEKQIKEKEEARTKVKQEEALQKEKLNKKLTKERVCKKCQRIYCEKDNSSTACYYHPGY